MIMDDEIEFWGWLAIYVQYWWYWCLRLPYAASRRQVLDRTRLAYYRNQPYPETYHGLESEQRPPTIHELISREDP